MTSALRFTALALVAILLLAAHPDARAQSGGPHEVTVTVRADQPGAKINRNIYGQFAEHLGHGIYGGIWVGENSSIPNTRGYRNDVVEALQKLQVPVIRWPGGCFADEYHWRDGIGPRDERPVRINTAWGGVEEPNEFGTHEFLDFVELINTEAYVAGNVGTGSPKEMAQWVEYITSDTNSTLAKERRANGREKPWRLPYFGVGNENWGCGGDMRPEYYTDLYRRFATFLDAPSDNRPIKVAGGANTDDYNWTEIMLSRAARYMDAYSIHYYTLPGQWEDKGPATGFDEDQWASTLSNAMRMDELVTKHSAIMDKYDPEKRIGLYVDEWGTWYDPTPGRNPGFLWQQNSLRDALVAALTFEIFHRHAERVRMGAIAQTVNVLQAMILTDEERMTLTPTYHVFRMYIPFQDATSLPVEVETPDYRHGDRTLPAVAVTAARAADGRINIAFVNLDPRRAATVSTSISGVRARGASGELLTAVEMDAHNTFDSPDTVAPEPFEAQRVRDALVVEIPPKAVIVVAVDE